MYCKHCGRQIGDTAAFCAFCGNPTGEAAGSGGAASAAAPYAEQTKNFLAELGDQALSFLRTAVKPALPAPAQERRGFQWIAVCLLNMLLFSLSFAVNLQQMLPEKKWYMDDIPFGKTFASNLLVSFLFYLFSASLTYLDVRFLRKRAARVNTVLNAFFIVSVPMAAVYLLNMLLGFLHFSVVLFLFLIGFITVLIARADAVRRLLELANVPLPDLAVINGVALIVSAFVGWKLYAGIVEDIVFAVF